MKEASGEASMTAVTIGLIAIVAVVAIPIVKTVIGGLDKGAKCAAAGGTYYGGKCYSYCDVADNGKGKTCSGEITNY